MDKIVHRQGLRMKVLDLVTICDQCSHITKHTTGYIPNYGGTITKSFWCQNCKEAQVVKFKFSDEEVEIVERLEPSEVYVPRKPDSGITIRPKAGKPKL